MSSLNDIETGKLIASIDTLTDEVKELRHEVDMLKEQMTKGKGIVIGFVLLATGMGASVSSIVNKFLGG